MYRICFFLILIGFLASCEDTSVKPSPYTGTYTRINTFTKDKMTDQYFWADEVKDKNIEADLDPATYFANMKYAGDPWSHITKSQGLGEIADASGNENGFGYNLNFWEDGGYIIAEVNFVYSNSPAAKAGLKRGDIITRMNGKKITTENYTDLYYNNTLSIGLSEDEMSEPYKTLELTAQNFTINPILEYGVITHDERKVGYVAYSNFVYRNATSLLQLNDVFQKLKEQGIEELILDLRYNTGGYMLAVKRLCSLIAPEEVVESEEILIHKRWNDAYQKKYADTPEMMEERFDKTVPTDARLNLPRLWVITSKVTASASELLISALSPYMEVHVIGETTVGKNMGGITFTPPENDLQGWNISLISLLYTNSEGRSVRNGIVPEIPVAETFPHRESLGDPKEPLLAVVLEMIPGKIEATMPARSMSTSKYRQIIPERVKANSVVLFENQEEGK
ncbi:MULTISPECIES: S41 family peptidase [Butyricimonas]|uniref:S41 family peptidase n=1 Tax=Butyricimonas TaxID=574697 RepID=UPI00037D8C01|nr:MULTISPECIES: S41 family peptidase [Butyricimonas]